VDGFKAAFRNGARFHEYNMQGDVAQGRRQALEIRGSDVDLVLAVGLKAALVSKMEIVDTPVIFCMVLDPAKHNLKAPNLTGILLEVPIQRQLAMLRSVLPNAKRIGVLFDPEKSAQLVEEARRQAKGLGLELVARSVSSEKEVPPTLRMLLLQIDALWLLPDSTVLTVDSLQFLMNSSLEAAVPVFGFSPDLVKSGALVGLSVHYPDLGRQAASLARTLLANRPNNQQAPSLGFAPPDRLRLSLNLKTAKFLGINVPPDIVGKADELY
jgi:putative ABC transport system substrate-binding protein